MPLKKANIMLFLPKMLQQIKSQKANATNYVYLVSEHMTASGTKCMST